jgi:signal transduction histidine kinase
MSRRTPILYLFLIGLPALLLTLAAIRLLVGVREQLASLEQERCRNLAEKVSGEVVTWVGALQTDLLRQVESLPQTDLPQHLRTLQQESPFIRNVFVWEKEKGVVFPSRSLVETEEQRFLLRFAPLFKGDFAWQENKQESDTYSSLLRSKVQVRKHRSGWIPWFEGNQLHLLGWTELGQGRIAGVELEMSAVLARLQNLLIPWTQGRQGGQGLELTDGQGVLVAAGGLGVLPQKNPALFEYSLAPMLPHWALKIAPNRTADKSVEGSIFWVGGLILLLLVVSLIAGGLLLVRDAILQRQEALQKTSFVSNVSHELKTPLTSIRMYAELLADNKATKPDVMRQYLNVIVTESERLTRLVNNVLDFGRLEQKRRQYHCEPVKLPEFVMTVLETLKGVLEASEMSLEIKAEAESLVLADRDALNRVLVNLVDNACKYAADGKSILVTIGNGKKQAFIAVADRGPGIPSTHVKRIFERFFRVDDSVTATVGGSGLGLSIAQQLMHGMGGDLHWSPREGGGSVFTVTLPREDEG